MTTTEHQVIHVGGLEGAFGSIPAMLGYHPQSAIVVLTMQRTDHGTLRAGPASAMKMSDYRANPQYVVEMVGDTVERYGPCCIVAGYGIDEMALEDFCNRLRERPGDIEILAAAVTDNGVKDIHPALHAAMTAAGKVISDSRDDREALLVHHSGVRADPELVHQFIDDKGRDKHLLDAMNDENKTRRVVDASRSVTNDGVGNDGTTYPRRTVANLCAVAAILSYRLGDGAAANILADRCISIDPGHQLGLLLIAGMRNGMPPAELDALHDE